MNTLLRNTIALAAPLTLVALGLWGGLDSMSTSSRAPSSLYPSTTKAPSKAPSGTLSYEQLEASLAGKVGSPDEFMKGLPEGVRGNFVLAFKTRNFRANEGVSAENPRVILFSDDGKLMMALNGSGPHAGRVDMVRYQEDTAEFEPIEWKFPAAGSGPPAIEVNPARCYECHRSHTGKFIPIFSPYGIWSGFFASDQDSFDSSPAQERKDFLKFKAAALVEKKPVYQHLIFGSAPLAPFHGSGSPSHTIARSPNQRLTMLISRLVVKFMLAHELKTPWFNRYQHALLAQLIGCDQWRFQQQYRPIVESLAKDLQSAGARPESDYMLGQLGMLLNFDYGHYGNSGSSDQFHGRVTDVDFRDGFTKFSELLAGGLLKSLVQDDGELKPFYKPDSYGYDNYPATDRPIRAINEAGTPPDLKAAVAGCELLLAKAKADLILPLASDKAESHEAQVAAKEPPPFNRCVSCHAFGDGRVAPRLPFDNLTALDELLTRRPELRSMIQGRIRNISRDGRMPPPPVPPLTWRESQAIEDYLRARAAQ